jgi:hypothetical protein
MRLHHLALGLLLLVPSCSLVGSARTTLGTSEPRPHRVDARERTVGSRDVSRPCGRGEKEAVGADRGGAGGISGD